MGDQTAWAMARVEQFLDEHGSSKVRVALESTVSREIRPDTQRARLVAFVAQDHVLATTLFVTDMEKKPAMNDAWAEWFAPTAVPARATIQIETLGERRLFEVLSPNPSGDW